MNTIRTAKKFIAHVKRNNDQSWAEPHWLIDHLENTARKAGKFARVFNSETWGYTAGIGHDSGKGRRKWEEYLMKKSGYDYDESAHLENIPGKLDHSSSSAKVIEELFGKGIGRVLSYPIAGHHAGLPDGTGAKEALEFRIQQADTSDICDQLRKLIANSNPGDLPRQFNSKGIDLALWIRMLFSCLVDADFLDTEEYMNPEKQKERGGYLAINELHTVFNLHMKQILENAPKTVVNSVRKSVLTDCRESACESSGFFSLTVPTGGGKTLSSMAFALKHAEIHNMDRIIYVIPYTSIIEQNAKVFREALGEAQIVEHHSNLDDDDSTVKARLAAENWDAPVIITTSVQFFESLFSARTSRCRKLHNICNSVIILDEAQLMPIEYLSPILRTMELLVTHYNVTFVICTATQPAFEKRNELPGFPGLQKNSVREIIKDVPTLYQKLKRVHIEIPADMKTPVSWNDLSKELSNYRSVLCVVSDRKSCKELYQLMPKGTYHLSALMCAEHRSITIDKIKSDLKLGKAVKVISTQLVEAGVNLDFPVVYRAIAGLDSIAQAAGRCNREGVLNKQEKLGKVVLFVPSRKPPPGILRKAAETSVRMLSAGISEPIDQSVFPPFFSELYWKANSLDGKGIIDLLSPEKSELGIQFRTAGKAFRLIDDANQRSLIVPFGEGQPVIDLLKKMGPERWLLRKLQRYTVNVHIRDFNELLNRGSLEEINPGIFTLTSEVEYDDRTGLKVNEELFDPEAYIF